MVRNLKSTRCLDSVGRKSVGDLCQYLIKWEGYPEGEAEYISYFPDQRHTWTADDLKKLTAWDGVDPDKQVPPKGGVISSRAKAGAKGSLAQKLIDVVTVAVTTALSTLDIKGLL